MYDLHREFHGTAVFSDKRMLQQLAKSLPSCNIWCDVSHAKLFLFVAPLTFFVEMIDTHVTKGDRLTNERKYTVTFHSRKGEVHEAKIYTFFPL